jgi:hypothetical protein
MARAGERVGVSESTTSQLGPRLEREKISAAEFSRLLFFSSLSPGAEMYQLGLYLLVVAQGANE